jgi:hypothetical protein
VTASRPAGLAQPAATSTPSPRPARNEGTVREILPPWHVLQEKLQNQKGSAPAVADRANEVVNRAAQEALAAQEAANASWGTAHGSPSEPVEMPPSSGVRMSEPGQAAIATPLPDDVAGSLSFKVYTLDELERRSDAPASMRSSRASFDTTASRTAQRWQRVRLALAAFAAASLAWVKIKGERPSLKVALRQPFDDLGDDLQVAVEAIDWKKLGVTSGIVIGATLSLLFAVLTAAELTDDLRSPGATAHLASSDTSGLPARTALDAHGVAPATNMAAMGVQPVAAPVALPTLLGDIDEPEAETPAPATKKPAAKKAKPRSNKLTLRSAPF